MHEICRDTEDMRENDKVVGLDVEVKAAVKVDTVTEDKEGVVDLDVKNYDECELIENRNVRSVKNEDFLKKYVIV